MEISTNTKFHRWPTMWKFNHRKRHSNNINVLPSY